MLFVCFHCFKCISLYQWVPVTVGHNPPVPAFFFSFTPNPSAKKPKNLKPNTLRFSGVLCIGSSCCSSHLGLLFFSCCYYFFFLILLLLFFSWLVPFVVLLTCDCYSSPVAINFFSQDLGYSSLTLNPQVEVNYSSSSSSSSSRLCTSVPMAQLLVLDMPTLLLNSTFRHLTLRPTYLPNVRPVLPVN